ncbi:helix-turn-helix transcriptional regulator [Microbacterium sp. CFH 90308]|uniref:Helix-turn-helix transcriptional regulator n=1 Tax=Microbacterium salsuginis TaxID=2722803 RepID=A0ABX1K908_9MICO|nr:helix-turn-helix transcriptional regulator [Microbacterium sp. CFH 90308]
MATSPTPWSEYLKRAAPDLSQADLAVALGQNDATVSRWLSGKTQRPDADTIVAVARKLGQSPVFALIATGYLTTDDLASTSVPKAYGLDEYTDLELSKEIVRRIEAGSATEALTEPISSELIQEVLDEKAAPKPEDEIPYIGRIAKKDLPEKRAADKKPRVGGDPAD